MDKDVEARRKCNCLDCQEIRKALSLLDDAANSPGRMSVEDINCLLRAREIVAKQIGSILNEETNRYE